MLQSNLASEPLAPTLAGQDLESAAQADANPRMVANFFRAQATEVAA